MEEILKHLKNFVGNLRYHRANLAFVLIQNLHSNPLKKFRTGRNALVTKQFPIISNAKQNCLPTIEVMLELYLNDLIQFLMS